MLASMLAISDGCVRGFGAQLFEMAASGSEDPRGLNIASLRSDFSLQAFEF